MDPPLLLAEDSAHSSCRNCTQSSVVARSLRDIHILVKVGWQFLGVVQRSRSRADRLAARPQQSQKSCAAASRPLHLSNRPCLCVGAARPADSSYSWPLPARLLAHLAAALGPTLPGT